MLNNTGNKSCSVKRIPLRRELYPGNGKQQSPSLNNGGLIPESNSCHHIINPPPRPALAAIRCHGNLLSRHSSQRIRYK